VRGKGARVVLAFYRAGVASGRGGNGRLNGLQAINGRGGVKRGFKWGIQGGGG
jgi:hypothetical protein